MRTAGSAVVVFAACVTWLLITSGCGRDTLTAPSAGRPIPNFAGLWTGAYNVVSCSGNTPDARTCSNLRTASPWPMTISVNQDKDRVTATLTMTVSRAQINLVGNVSSCGELVMDGTEFRCCPDPTTYHWLSTLDSSGQMQGSFQQRAPGVDFGGNFGYLTITENVLQEVRRTQ